LVSKAVLFLDIHSRLLTKIKDFDSRAVAYAKDIERVKRNSSAGVLTSGLTVATLLKIIPEIKDEGIRGEVRVGCTTAEAYWKIVMFS